MIEDGLRQFLIAQSAITALIKTRIFPVILPNAVECLPCATWQTISTVEDSTNDGPTGFVKARIQIDTWSFSYLETKLVAEAIRTALDGFKGQFPNGVHVLNVLRDNVTDSVEKDSRLFRTQTDWCIIYAQ